MTTTVREHQGELAPPPHAVAPSWRTRCLNCDSTLVGPFCAQCGQRAAPPHPSLRELGGEAFAELSGWDGKLASTLKLLMGKPGELTRQFLDGRRAHFISPLRLYLTASLVFFLFAGRAPITSTSRLGKPGAPAPAAATSDDEARRRELLANVASAPAIMRPLILKAATDQPGLVAGVMDALPKGLFALLPFFAAILMVFYRERRFAEHLYFAIHVHAFIFVAFDVAMVLQRVTRSATISLVFAVAASLWIPIYTHLALVRVYGGSQTATVLKELGISALYALASLPMILMLGMWVAWRSP
jgi:hypothetical protein